MSTSCILTGSLTSSVTIEALTQAMDNKIVELGGMDAAISAADLVYSSSYRSEDSYTVSEMGLTLDNVKHDLVSYFIECEITKRHPELDCENMYDLEEIDSDSLQYARESAYNEIEREIEKGTFKTPYGNLNEETRFVYLCNYKGEGEDEVLPLEMAGNISIFHSKYNYS